MMIVASCTAQRLWRRSRRQWRPRAEIRQTCQALGSVSGDAEDASDAGAGTDAASVPPAGLAGWRAQQKDDTMSVPTILFPVSDLLLIGHTKRMHLFEPRWVNMIDTARAESNGIIGLVYFDGRGEVVLTTTLAEVIACSNLGSAGRMVTVRGVSRARLSGLSEEVLSPRRWGVALVSELPEICPGDGPSGGVATAASELVQLVLGLDLSVPGSEAPSSLDVPAHSGATDKSDADNGEVPDTPELWTHEQPSTQEELGRGFDADVWARELEAVNTQIQGVPLCRAGEGQWNGDSRDAVATLYAVLGRAALQTRIELFESPQEMGLEQRLRSLVNTLQEKQGMARARRAIAAAFTPSGDSESDSSIGGGNDKDAGC